MKKLLLPFIACTIIALFTYTPYAQELQVVTENLEPYNFRENQEVVGIATDIVRATLEQAGIEAEIELFPWARTYKIATEMPNVLIFSLTRTAEREQLFHWIAQVTPPIEVYLYKLKEREDIIVNSFDEAKQYTTGVVRDDITHQILLKNGLQNDKHLFATTQYDACVKNFFGGRVDIITGNVLQLATTIKGLGYSTDSVEKLMPILKQTEGLYMALSQGTSPEIADRLRAAFEQIQKEGKVQAIYDKYYTLYGLQ